MSPADPEPEPSQHLHMPILNPEPVAKPTKDPKLEPTTVPEPKYSSNQPKVRN